MLSCLRSIAVAALALSGAAAQNLKQKPVITYIEYSSVPGYFLQDSNTTNPSTFDFVRRQFLSIAATQLPQVLTARW
jgi:hypothetical protein